jgi:hypothetical protein
MIDLFDETDAIAPLHVLDDDRSRSDNCSAPDSSSAPALRANFSKIL